MKLLAIVVSSLVLAACGDAEPPRPKTEHHDVEPALGSEQLERELDEIEREIAPDAGR
jgi:hypothetical protein